MVSRSELLEKFQITGCENLSDEVLEKCVELCHHYEVDEEGFVDMWFAFGVSHLDGNLEPTMKGLEEMKRSTPKPKAKSPLHSTEKHEEAEKNYSNSIQQRRQMDEEDEILGIYSSEKSALLQQTKRPSSPDPDDRNVGGCKRLIAECSQADFEPIVVSSQPGLFPSSQSPSLNKSQVGSKLLTSIGPKVSTWVTSKKHKYIIRHAGPHVPSNSRYMFELLKTTSSVRTLVGRMIGYKINNSWMEQKKDDILFTWNVRTRQQEPYRTWGRVCFQSETKQSNPTVLLEGCKKPPRTNNPNAKLWPQVELDASDLRECCLFPGQIIAVEGINLTENILKVKDMYTGSFIPPSKPPQLTDDLNIVVAAGPFTQSSDLNYQALWELMAKVAEDEPHILILIGPFLDFSHPLLQSDAINCTYQEYFNRIIAKIKSFIDGKCTQVVLVASSRDLHHHAVYPTPEYSLSKSTQSPDIHVLPDPCILDIDGLRLGITSIDCLMHLGREEVVLKSSGTDKLSRLGNYILNQACFYPLYPPAKGISIDSELWEKYAFLKEKPHMLLLPSDMRYFCKNINESVILNPERLSKRTFARMLFKPSTENSWSYENISCEIIKM